jgi:hypothetical protein
VPPLKKIFYYIVNSSTIESVINRFWIIFTFQLHSPDPPETLPKACNADLVDIESVTEDVTKIEVQQSWRIVMLRIQKVPLQAFSSLPGGSVLGFCMQC